MSGPAAVIRALAGLLFLLLGLQAARAEPERRLLFTGDILLARETAREIAARNGASPWSAIAPSLKSVDLLMGNLEGAVGDMADCEAPLELCFAVAPHLLPLLKQAGFTAIGIANNHSGDLGAAGRQRTRDSLRSAGLVPIGSEESPAFVRLGNRTVAIVSLSLVPGRDSIIDAVPSWQAAQKLRLARALADWVVVFIHWGKELADWTVPEQEAQAKWLVGEGVDVIIGAHPHVVQKPTCLDGRPVFYSLGNHVFDQKYEATKHGLIAECTIANDRLVCGKIATETPRGSSNPRVLGAVADPDLAKCQVPAGQPLALDGETIRAWGYDRQISSGRVILEASAGGVTAWRTVARELVGAEVGQLMPGKPPMLFTLERHLSSMDAEDGPRPYVYDITPHGLIARWRGSALAWPLLDARLITGQDGQAYLCALHRGDSFIMLDPAHPASPRIQTYRWNGFGFSGDNDPGLAHKCSEAYPDIPLSEP